MLTSFSRLHNTLFIKLHNTLTNLTDYIVSAVVESFIDFFIKSFIKSYNTLTSSLNYVAFVVKTPQLLLPARLPCSIVNKTKTLVIIKLDFDYAF